LFPRNGENAERLAELSDQILHIIWEANPVGATILGVHDYDNTLGDVSASGFKGYCSSLKGCINALESEVDPSHLDGDQQLNHRLAIALAHSYLIMFEGQRAWQNNPSIYSSQAVWGCLSLLMRHPGPMPDRLRPVLDRMREIPDMLSESKKNILNPASVFTQIALGVNQGALAFFRDELPALATGTPLAKDILDVNVDVVKAFEDYSKWLVDDVLPRANGSFSIGHRVYEQMLHREHCLTCSPSDLVTLGQEVLRQSQESIAELARSIDPSVRWPELVRRLKTEHPSKDDLVDAYRRAVESAKDFVIERDLVTIPDGADLGVGITPEVERTVMPYAAYFPPAPFGNSKNGSLWVTPIDESAPAEQQHAQLLEHCIYSIPIIALHEGIPGHHLQLTHAMDSPHLVRRQMLNSLLMEGWALYCEELMREEGFYSDPRIVIFQLKDMVWRACRVIIDVGLHTGEMSFEDAVDMLVRTAYIDEACAAAEVRRYAMSPTQPMTYVVGKLMFLDLRDYLKNKMGSAFSLKDFHDRLLSFGSIPPPLIIESIISDAARDDRPDSRVRRSA
jgi:uncharacterized protein (DUF885 family)